MRFSATTLLLVFFALGTVATLRAADPVATDADRLQESRAKWEKARADCGGDYSYQVRWSSAFGFGHTTTITVKGNKVVERSYLEFGRPEPVKPGEQPLAPKPKWVETEKDLGSHQEGAAARTVDELYAEAKKVAETPVPAAHQRHLGFDAGGLLSYCFTRDTRIADDAPAMGVRPFQLQLKAKR